MPVLSIGDVPVGLVTKHFAKLAHAISPFQKMMQDRAIMASVEDAIKHMAAEHRTAKSFEMHHFVPCAPYASAGERWRV